MGKFSVHKCPVCQGTEFSDFLTCTDFFVSGEQFTVKTCVSCGFKITENIDDENGIHRFYESDEYISHSDTSTGLVNSAYHYVRRFMLGQKRRLLEKSAGVGQGRVLDVGAGTGYFLHQMRNRGWNVSGTEKSGDARNFARREFGLDLLPTEELFRMKDDSFHVITLWHVLEHIHRLEENMEAFYRLLKKQGKLIIAVPNHVSYDAIHYKQFWAAWDVPRHIWHFSPKQMKLLGERYGFRLLKIKSMPFDSFYVSILSEKYRKSKWPLFKGIVHGKISWWKSLLDTARCSSVIYIFEKIIPGNN